MSKFLSIVEAVIKNDGIAHEDQYIGDNRLKIQAIGRFSVTDNNNENHVYAVAMYLNHSFKLYPIELDKKGIPHILTESVGGVVSKLDMSNLKKNYVGRGTIHEVIQFAQDQELIAA